MYIPSLVFGTGALLRSKDPGRVSHVSLLRDTGLFLYFIYPTVGTVSLESSARRNGVTNPPFLSSIYKVQIYFVL